MCDDEYRPLANREREPKSRVHEELSEIARERLSAITDDWGRGSVTGDRHKKRKYKAQKEVFKSVGKSPILSRIPDEFGSLDKPESVHAGIIRYAKTQHVLTYIELLAIETEISEAKGWTRQEAKSRSPVAQSKYGDIVDVLVSEGILWEVDYARKGGIIEFRPMESEAMEEIDSKVRALSQKERWSTALEGYNAAFERYLDGDFDDVLVKKLYNSIEAVLHTICVDLQGWTEDRERSHSYYLDLLRENDFYRANGITAPELGQLIDSLERLVDKTGYDRKQEHAYHDRAYCTLLVHQVGAYLYFLISRYEANL